jgi:hypothetical protein
MSRFESILKWNGNCTMPSIAMPCRAVPRLAVDSDLKKEKRKTRNRKRSFHGRTPYFRRSRHPSKHGNRWNEICEMSCIHAMQVGQSCASRFNLESRCARELLCDCSVPRCKYERNFITECFLTKSSPGEFIRRRWCSVRKRGEGNC